MALSTRAVKEELGLEIPNAYARVHRFVGNKDSIDVHVTIHARDKQGDVINRSIETLSFTMPYVEITGEILPSIYTWLKQQPRFADAKDC